MGPSGCDGVSLFHRDTPEVLCIRRKDQFVALKKLENVYVCVFTRSPPTTTPFRYTMTRLRLGPLGFALAKGLIRGLVNRCPDPEPLAANSRRTAAAWGEKGERGVIRDYLEAEADHALRSCKAQGGGGTIGWRLGRVQRRVIVTRLTWVAQELARRGAGEEVESRPCHALCGPGPW
jgi:hypothetical protein